MHNPWPEKEADRLPGMPGRRVPAAIPQEICPSEDDPLAWFHRMGWAFMTHRLWGEDALFNPLIFYLVGKRWRALFGDLVGTLPWIALVVFDVSALVASAAAVNLGYLFSAILLELLFLPGIIGVWTTWMVLLHYSHVRHRVPMEELSLTRIRPQELVNGFSLRPIIVQQAANAGSAFTFGIIYMAGLMLYFLSYSLFNPFTMMLIMGLLLLRTYILKNCIEFAGILALRCCLYIPSMLEAGFRAARDWIIPWGIVPFFFVAALAASIALYNIEMGFFILLIIVPILELWALFQVPHLLKNYAEDTLFWAVKSYGDWAIQTGIRSRRVPNNILRRWKLARYQQLDPKERKKIRTFR